MSNLRNYSFSLESTKLAVVGLGYVGLPLAVEFGKYRSVIGFDINAERIEDLRTGYDETLEVSDEELAAAANLRFSSTVDDLETCNVYIVTVPTPIDAQKRPDLAPLKSASEALGRVLKCGDLVIYESTVFPGATEEECVPILESASGLKFNIDFFTGYSPERINPGDKTHRLTTITKVTSGSTPAVADFVDDLYSSIVVAGTYKASSIKVAEAAKVIENTQRDLNIALINELAMIFNELQVDTREVLEAAATKWNFLPFSPGLVGGHCIGVDPFYLTYKAQAVGYDPHLILAGRRINDGMGEYIASNLIKKMTNKGVLFSIAKILILGFTFKENCPDIRNTRVIDIYNELLEYGLSVDVCDPWVDDKSILKEYDINLQSAPDFDTYDAIILAVAHSEFINAGVDELRKFGKQDHIFFDLKSVFPKASSDFRL